LAEFVLGFYNENISERSRFGIEFNNSCNENKASFDDFMKYHSVLILAQEINALHGVLFGCKSKFHNGQTPISDRYKFAYLCRNEQLAVFCRDLILFVDEFGLNNTQQPSSPTKQPQQTTEIGSTTDKLKQSYFTRAFSETEQKKLFDGLTNDGFLHKETTYSHFCFVFGGVAIPENEKPFEPLIWQKTVGLLAYCIENLFADTDGKNLWEITEKCFLWKSNPPNKDTMKNTVTKYKNNNKEKPKGHDNIDNIISSI
jgi:hypothetical protein